MVFQFSVPIYTLPQRLSPLLAPCRLTLNPGAIACLMGPSGVGKTTFLKIVSGVGPNHFAWVTLPNGQQVFCEEGAFGYLPQTPLLLPWKTVKQNVALAVLNKNAENREVEKILDAVGLLSSQHLYPSQLSLGMASRVAFARELVRGTQVIFMDEPFASWDLSLKNQIFKDLISLTKQLNTSILFTTHSGYEAQSLAQDIYILKGQPAQLEKMSCKRETGEWDPPLSPLFSLT